MKQGWEYKKLGEVATFINGYAFKPDQWKEYGTPIVRIQNLNNPNAPYNYFDGEVPDKVKIGDGDLLISWSASLGAYIWNGGNAFLNQHIFKVAFDKTDVDKIYLKYAVTSKLETMAGKVHGATMKHIVKKDFDNTLIPYPPKSTQLSIVSEFDKINELIRLKKEQLKDYDNLAQSIFYEMFGDPVENEKGWEVKKWKDVFNTILGKMLDKSKQINHLTQYKYLANMNVQWGYFDLKELRSMTFTDEELAKYELRNNDLLICEGGDAGRCAIWKETDETILFQKAIHRARLIDTNNADVVYIRYWMQFYKVNKGLKDYISKSTIEHLTGDKLKRLPIPLPPLQLQHLFAQRIEQIERQKSAVQKSITDLETLLASRMQYWFE